ncbi:hypothetical protein FC83_GL001832 [Agrilactobacillus composti DSM 18527 = JCM 14202]|uniref:Surface layer protein A domain-containing protein n=1 Tax=Agrilactobacillus composti DSM 18527 = JCM 14202 TaxID=1423734 RepID=X0PNS9_9LACO|nr:hypothetical protein [Agrilactobacillus composti]KRM35047.1 hypothetical protein FC83_GL001832 [Agrilactobacillus composti DSM 18527 = JCM 14202]GAF39252.1 hypothetical protein JCM14202_1102 [Agrilactobacillus composti DSM 18527 = JCM 14202]
MRKKILGFILLVASALLLTVIPAKSVSAADDEVAFPIRDSSFLTLNDNDYQQLLAGKLSYFNSDVTSSYVPGLSVWKLSNLFLGSWSRGGEADPWYRWAQEIYEVGPNLLLTNKQALRIPVDKVTNVGVGSYLGTDAIKDGQFEISWVSNFICTVKNNGPVTLWQSPDYLTPVQTVASGDKFTVNQVYFSYKSGLWFDIGANQWIPAFYLENNLIDRNNLYGNAPEY